MSGTQTPPQAGASPASVTRRNALQRLASPMALFSGGLLIAGALGVWFWFGRSSGVPEYDAVETRPVLPHRIARPPEPALPATPVFLPPPVVPHQFQMPVLPPVVPSAQAAPVNVGPMFTHYSAPNRASAAHPGGEDRQPTSAAARSNLTYRQAPVEVGESTVIIDRARTIKPTTRVPCTLTQAIDGTHAGPFTCVVTRPVLAWDNNPYAPALPAGTPVQGTYQPLTTGQGRMMALAATAWRSDGLAVPLGGSPITDELGRVGMDGYVDNRFWARVGNALLVDAAVSAINLPSDALRSQGRGIQFNTSDTQRVVGQVLESTVNLPPLFKKNQGEEVIILITAPVHLGAVRYEASR